MIRVFTGWDERESAGWHTFSQSAVERSKEVVAVIPLNIDAQRDGTNAFTYSRFLVPHLCGFQGRAIFVDGVDMVCMSDIAELWYMPMDRYAVRVVKHDYQTKHPRKYVGTEMEAANSDYPRKNWSSVIVWDCEHPMNRRLSPEFVDQQSGSYLHRFSWLPDELVGDLPVEWNWLCDEYGFNAKAKMLHWTAGIPSIYAYRQSPHAQAWQHYSAKSLQSPAEKRIAEVASQR